MLKLLQPLLFLINVTLVELHGPDGQVFYVNSAQVTSIRAPTGQDLRNHFARGTHCVVVTTSGKFLPTSETCAQIRDLIGNH